ncbi:Zinc transporter ZIP1 [Holothuria leucospilota]|uniref:Zinc transporter ZIP1 n=1 Tax=Holothuria leucospilota TaxID=206669 RepID=A0A9Q1BJX3_HOLLE|nr:Zinc transporter ZIP1 [Holothuria leucospilota]
MHIPSTFRSLLLLGALSFHSILEGIAVGILSSSTQVWTLVLAIAIHKSVISFSLSINFLTSMKKLNAIFCQIVFAVMSPLGIAIGMVIVSQIDNFSSSIWQAILQGGATGTFLYVTFFELLPREIEAPRDKFLKVLSILVGFGVIAGLITYEVRHE